MRRLDTPVFDFHVHAGRWGNKTADDDVGRILKAMDAAGVDRCNVNCIFHGDAKRGNDIVSRLVAAHPDRFVGVAFVTPHYPGETIAELERAFDTLGMRSLKLYPTYFQRPIDDPGYLHIFEWCNERGVVIMSHSSYVGDHDMLSNPHRFIALAQRYDRIRWVLAHSGNSAIGQKQAVEAAQAVPEHLPGDVHLLWRARHHRVPGRGGWPGPGTVRLGHSPDGPPAAGGPHRHRRYS